MAYYMMEVGNIGAVCKADKINAKNFTSAKRTASKNQCFQKTILYIGTDVNENGFITNPIARKLWGEKWEDLRP